MKFSKVIARKFLFPTIVNSGFEKVIRNRSDYSTLNVLYHGVVLKDCTDYTIRHISIEQFEKHLKYFKKYLTLF